MATTEQAVIYILMALLLPTIRSAQLPSNNSPEVAPDVRIDCSSNDIVVAIDTKSGVFNGMIYPKGLSKNSTCMSEFLHQRSPVRYRLPLRSCNTMSTDLDDGGVEYFNTIVVQPHLKLVTNQGRGFHIRCRYQTRDKTISNNMNISMMEATPLNALAPMPGCTMKIFYGDPQLHEVAENVKIGDPLTLVVSIDDQETFGLRVTDCLVRDGLGWGEQRLVNEEGCPVDKEIMGQFHYTNSKTTASVHFQAHKFPYTASVYYQCNVRLCVKAGGGCDDLPPSCGSNEVARRRRDADGNNKDGTPATTIEVYSGLYVNEATDAKVDSTDDVAKEKTPEDPNSFCISQRYFAIGIAIAGLILMLAVIVTILILLALRRRRKDASATGSSIYSGPYTNTAYSHSS
ncbi:cuticlin-3 isoform X2 [Anabrus simplex]